MTLLPAGISVDISVLNGPTVSEDSLWTSDDPRPKSVQEMNGVGPYSMVLLKECKRAIPSGWVRRAALLVPRSIEVIFESRMRDWLIVSLSTFARPFMPQYSRSGEAITVDESWSSRSS